MLSFGIMKTMKHTEFKAAGFVVLCVATFMLIAMGKNGTAETFARPHYVIDSAISSTTLSAQAWLLFDAETGEVLGGKNIDTVLPIASVTKLLTAETAISSLDLNASTTISWRAVATEGKAGSLKANDVMNTRELLFPLLLESSNDAAEALAESVKREVFIGHMNDNAKKLGMDNTKLQDPSGLSSGNVSTTLDLQKLLMHLYTERRHILDITHLTTFVGSKHMWQNNDPIFSSAGFIGGKHGYTEEAERTFAAIFDEKLSLDVTRPIGIILLGSDNLKTDMQILTEGLHASVHYEYDIR